MNHPEAEITELLIRTRRHLHAHPEVSHDEFDTTKFILEFLRAHASPDDILPLSSTGVICVFKGKETGPVTLVRADIDALPIHEGGELPYHSVNNGVSHKCGHDGHTTILLGLAMELSVNRVQKGTVVLLFQPAEEVGEGAGKVLRDEVFQRYEIDQAFALHNLPHYPANSILVKEGSFTAHVKSLIIELSGKTAHAAEPENGCNPSTTIAHLLLAAEELNHNDPSSDSFFLITPVHATLGRKAYGVSAGEGEVHFTVRAWDVALFDRQCKRFIEKANQVAHARGISVSTSWVQEFDANSNHPESVALIKSAASELGLDILELESPFKWGEDFGKFTQIYKGAMFGLGAGRDIHALHHPGYDFPDGVIRTGIDMFHHILIKIHGSSPAYDQD